MEENIKIKSEDKKEPWYWDEISQDKKIERLREQIKRRDKQIEDLRKEIRKLTNHIHGANGELLVPYRSGNDLNADCEKSGSIGGVYF